MTHSVMNRDHLLRTQHALSEAEIAAYVLRCPEEHRWAFEPYLRGERNLAGDLIEHGSDHGADW